MAVVGLDHVQLAIPAGGEDRARWFFSRLLGMAELKKPKNLSSAGCWFIAGGTAIHVGIDPDFRPAKKAHPALLVDDLATARAQLAEAGCVIRDEKPVEGYGRFFTEDPFGNRIELMERLI